jgi:alginate export protein
MRLHRHLLLIFICALSRVPSALAQDAGGGATPNRSYSIVPSDEDWSFLANPVLREDFWDPIKYIPIRRDAKGWYLSIGGQMRETWEQIRNDNWGQQPYTNGYLNQRYLLHLDVHYGEHFRTYVELKSGLNSGRIGGPRPIDEKKLDFAAAWVEAAASNGPDSIKFRVGRHELEYGSGRLIDVREGPNVRLSFDGFVAKERFRSLIIDEFAVRPLTDAPGIFTDAPTRGVGFWGVYGTLPLSSSVFIDLYYLGLDRDQAAFERGVGHEIRHSVGARLFRPIATEKPDWDFDFEGVEQFGTFNSASIEAWTFASDTGYRIPTVIMKPRFSLKADISSGDSPGTKTLGTFNPLFPKGNYFGVLATTGPGPINFIDVHPRIETDLSHGVTWSVDWIFQWRENLNDGVYAVPGFLIQAADGSRAGYVGDRPGTELRWQVDRHLWFQADYGVFYAGKFLKETGPGANIDYTAFYAGYKF